MDELRENERPTLDVVAQRWNTTTRERAECPLQGWLDSPTILEGYVQPRVSGQPRTNWLLGLAERLGIPKGGTWLSLGCGAADQEIEATARGLCSRLVALDASLESVEEGRRKGAARGLTNIEFATADLNHLDLSTSTYDLVLMNMSLHHVKRLGHVLSEVMRSLRPDGFFLINEFVGPRQFQFTDLQLQLVRELLDVLPDRWRRDTASGRVKTEYVRLPIENWNRADPSEAIRSDRIISEIERRFEVVLRIDYGGTILNPLLENIVHNFDPQDEKDVAALRLLARVENVLIRAGVLPSDFTILAMRRASKLRRFLPAFWRRGPRRSAFGHSVLPGGEALSPVADFRNAPHSEALIAGFHHWEDTFRWMTRSGEILLRMTSGRLSLLFAAPFLMLAEPTVLRIRLLDEASGRSVTLAPVRVLGTGPTTTTLDIPRRFASRARGGTIRVTLECNNVWVPARTLRESEDFRELTIQVLRVGFEPDTLVS